MDVFLPRKPICTPTPAVLWFHAGAWRQGGRKSDAGAILLATNGFISASIDYRLSTEARFPAAIEDCKAAVRFLRANAATYGIDPEGIGVAGASAGGHLALLVAMAGEEAGLEGRGEWGHVSSHVAAACSWYGPTDFTVGETAFDRRTGRAPMAFLGGTLQGRRDIYLQASPITYVGVKSPPILVIHGKCDEIVPYDQSERMFKACERAGSPAELILVEGAGHDFTPVGGQSPSVTKREIRAKTVQFFVRHLAGSCSADKY